MVKPSEFMYEARDEIAKGWCQGVIRDNENNVCAMGAIYNVTKRLQSAAHYPWDMSGDVGECYYTASKGLDEYARELGYPSIVFMNDQDKTTQQDMVNAFHKVGLALEEQGR